MTVKLSDDEGKTWPVSRTLYEGPSAYSSLTVLPNGHIGCLYEKGKENAYETLTLACFPLTWVQQENE
jgi:sialidase-1